MYDKNTLDNMLQKHGQPLYRRLGYIFQMKLIP